MSLGITDGKGFHMTFPNGNTVSVQFGYGNYCDNKNDDSAGRLFNQECKDVHSETAEVAAWGPGGDKGVSSCQWYSFGCDQVCGWLNAEQVLSFINFVATSDLSKDRWPDPDDDG